MNQLGRDIRRFLPLFVLLAIGVAFFAFLMAGVYPSIREQVGLMLAKVPPFLRPFIEKQLGNRSFEGFMGLGFTHPMLLGLYGTWAIALASNSVAGEIERGTLGITLSYPLSRASYLFSRLLVLFGGLFLLSFLLLPCFWLAFTIYHYPHAGIVPYLWASGGNFLLYGAIAAPTLWISAVTSESGPSIKFGAGLLLLAFFFNYLSQFLPQFAFLRWISFFAYFQPATLLQGNPLGWLDLSVLGGTILLGLTGAFWHFLKRDLSI